jgi:methylenetetrahydrofolate dehydrogenase (NADP+) / methenyltetrahydrofolate cyclohydrolase
MQIIDGKLIARQIEEEIQKKIAKSGKKSPGLAFVRVGDNPASKIYISMKKKKCQEVGIVSYDQELSENTSEKELSTLIEKLNADPYIHGILIQLPLPPHLNPLFLLEKIAPHKDVDGFHPINMGKLLLGDEEGIVPCTPKGIHELLLRSQIKLEGKHVVIVGRSNIVGKPLAALMMQKHPLCNATVTVAHSRSHHLRDLCKQADILVCAMGSPLFIQKDFVQAGAVVVDVGMNKHFDPVKNAHVLVGDVDFANVAPLCSHITPVPGGVGPMTIAMLLHNTTAQWEKSIQ